MASEDHNSDGQQTAAHRLAFGCAALALCLVACKACFLPWTGLKTLNLLRWLARLAAISASDVAFVCALWAFLRLALAACRRLSAPAAAFWIPAGMLLASATLFGVVNVPVFLTLNVQLSYPLLSLVGTWREFATSVIDATPWHAWLAAVVLPGLVLAAAALPPSRRLAAPQTGLPLKQLAAPKHRKPRAALCWIALLCYLAGASWWCHARWPQLSTWQRRAARSPHVQFLYSLATGPARPWTTLLQQAQPAAKRTTPAQPAGALPASQPSPALRNVVLLVLESVAAPYLQV